MNIVDRINYVGSLNQKYIYEWFVVSVLQDLSENHWAASWYSGIEFYVWEDITEHKGNVLSDEHDGELIKALLHASVWLGGWFVYGSNGITFVDINTMGQLYNNWLEETKNSEN